MINEAEVLKYDIEKGYGFLVLPDRSRHFFHITSCKGFVPQPGMKVSFEIGQGRRGVAAVNLQLITAVSAAPETSAGVDALAGDTSKSEVSRG